MKRLGKSVALNFTAEEQRLYGLKVGQAYDIEISPASLPHSQNLKGGRKINGKSNPNRKPAR